MATIDRELDTLDLTLAVVGVGSLPTAVLTYVGARIGVPPAEVEGFPSLPMSLGVHDSAGRRVFLHLSAIEADLARSDGGIAILGEDAAGDELVEDLPRAAPVAYLVDVPRRRAALPEAARAPGATVVDGDVRAGGGVYAAIQHVARELVRALRVGVLVPSPLPHHVREGLHRHDRSPSPALGPHDAPRRGDHVTLQINLREPLTCVADVGEVTASCVMRGAVVEILGPDQVVVDVVATSDRVPAALDGPFRARLARLPGWTYPWVLASLERNAQALSGTVRAASA